MDDFSILVDHRHSELLFIYGKYREAIGWTAEHGAIDKMCIRDRFYGAKVDGAVDRNNSEGRGGAIPSLGEIRNCHINVGTGKELTIRELSELVVKAVGFEGEVEFDASKPDGTMRKLISVCLLYTSRCV